MVNYTRLAATAKRLLNANGRPVTLTKKNRAPGDSNKPWRGPSAADTTTQVYAVVAPFAETDGEETVVRRGTARAFIASNDAPGIDLSTYDFVNDGGKIWKIDSVASVNPGSTMLVYKMMLKE